MHHVGFNWDTNDMFDMFIQSGTKHLFLTFGLSVNRNDIGNTAISYNDWTHVLYAGVGSEFRFWISSIDFEVLEKFVINPGLYPHNNEELSSFNLNQFIIPSFRLTWNVVSGQFLDFSLGATFDLYIRDKNDTAFALTTHQNGIVGSDTTLYPSYFIGFKIK